MSSLSDEVPLSPASTPLEGPRGIRRPEEFQRALTRAIVAPLAIMAIVALGMSLVVQQLRKTEELLRESDLLIENANVALRHVLELPGAIRGYVITGSPEFLEPARGAPERAVNAVTLLGRSKRVPPDETAELIRYIRGYEQFMKEVEAVKESGGNYSTLVATLRGKVLIDRTRSIIEARIAAEEAVRNERARSTEVISRFAFYSAVFLIVVAAAVLVAYSRRSLREAAASFERLLDERDHLLVRERELRLSAESGALQLAHARDTLENRVRERTASLEAANRELEAFSYSVSHDLRAPIRHIAGFAELLLRKGGDQLDPTLVRYARTINEAARNAGRLVDDLLAFSRVGRAEMRSSAVHLGNLLEEVRTECSHEAEGRKVTWKVGPLPTVTGDAALLRLVLQNLVSNALKYTGRREEAVIEIGSREEGDEHVVWVRDNGVGFDPRYSDKLFGVFQRLHSAAEFEGTGIGLANVRRIVLRHGGRTWAEGRPGEGATFYFSIPDEA